MRPCASLYAPVGNSTGNSLETADDLMFKKWQDEMDKGALAYKMRDFATAGKHFETAVDEAEKFGHNNSSLAQSLERLGEAILGQAPLENERVEACFTCYERACSIYEAVHGPVHTKVAECLTVMAKLLFWFNAEEAEKFARRAVSIFEELNSDKIGDAMEVLIGIASLSDRKEERDAMMQQMVDRFEKRADVAPIPLAKSLVSMARRDDKNSEAIPKFKRALQLLANSDETSLIVETNVLLGRLLFQEEEFLEAESCFQKALQLGECAPNVPGTHLEEALCRLARLHCYLYQDFAETERLLKLAEGMREPNGTKPIGSGYEMERLYLAKARNDLKAQEEEHRKDLNNAREQLKTDTSEWKELHEMSCIMHGVSLATIIYRNGKQEEAAQLWEAAHRDAHPASWIQTKATFRLAIHYAKCGRMEKAKKYASLGLKDVTADTGSDNLALAIVVHQIIGETEKIEPLIEYLTDQLKEAKAKTEDEYGEASTILSSLAYAYAGLGRPDKSLEFVDELFASERKKDSLFIALAYEAWVPSFEQEGYNYISERLRERAKVIRANIIAKVERMQCAPTDLRN